MRIGFVPDNEDEQLGHDLAEELVQGEGKFFEYDRVEPKGTDNLVYVQMTVGPFTLEWRITR